MMLEPRELRLEAWTWRSVPADGRAALGWCDHPENVCSDGGRLRADQHQAQTPRQDQHQLPEARRSQELWSQL